MRIETIKSKREYRVKGIHEKNVIFTLDDSGKYVELHFAAGKSMGFYKISRFNNELNPANIRSFLDKEAK